MTDVSSHSNFGKRQGQEVRRLTADLALSTDVPKNPIGAASA